MQLFGYLLVSCLALANAGTFHPLISKLVTVHKELFAKRSAVENLPVKRSSDEGQGCNVVSCVSSLQQAATHPASRAFLESLTTVDAIDLICTELGKTSDCMKAAADNCPGDMATILTTATVDGVVGYLCSEEGRELAVSQEACWENKKAEKAMEDCTELVHMSDASAGDMGAICSYFDLVRECATNAVQRECNSLAAKFIDNITYHTMKPVQAFMGCQMRAPA